MAELFVILPEAARYPFFLMFLVSQLDSLPKSKHPQFKKLYTEYLAAWRAAGREKPAILNKNNDEIRSQLAELARIGGGEVVTAIILLEWGSSAKPDKVASMRNVARAVPDMADYIELIMACSFSEFDAIRREVREGNLASDSSGKPDPRTKVAPLTETGGHNTLMQPSDTSGINTGAGKDGMASSVSDWNRTLGHLIDRLQAARGEKPDQKAVADIEELTRQLSSNYETYDQVARTTSETAGYIAMCSAIVSDVRQAFDQIEILTGDLAVYLETVCEALSKIPASTQNAILLASTQAVADAEVAVAECIAAKQEYERATTLPLKEYFRIAPAIVQIAETTGRRALSIIESASIPLLDAEDQSPVLDKNLRLSNNLSNEDSQCETYEASDVNRDAPALGETSDANTERSEIDQANSLKPNLSTDLEAMVEDQFSIPALPVIQPTVINDADPLLEDINQKLDDLFDNHEFGLGYHLAKASEVTFGEIGRPHYSSDEFRIFALGERLVGVTKFEPEGFRESLGVCASAVHARRTDLSAREEATRVALIAAVIPTALFDVSDSVNAFAIIDAIPATGACSGFFRLKEALEDNRKSGFVVTVANIRSVSGARAGQTYAEELREAVFDRIRSLETATFRFVLGLRVRRALTAATGEIGTLHAALMGPRPAEAASRFFDAYGSRDDAVDLLNRLAAANGNGQVIDGAARDRLIALIIDIAFACKEYLDATREADELRANSNRGSLVRNLVSNFLSGIQYFETQPAQHQGNRLVETAYVYAKGILRKLKLVLTDGVVEEFDRKAASLALHVPLLWLPGMTWSHAWTPSPNDAVRLIETIVATPVPLLSGGREEALGKAIDARCQEDGFLPARMLLEFARDFGWTNPEIDDARARLRNAEITRTNQLRLKYDEVSILIQKVRRMALGSLTRSSELEEKLRGIPIEDIPVEVISDFIPEEVEGTRVVDINAAFQRLGELENEARKLLDEAKTLLEKSIDELSQKEIINQDVKENLLRLLNSDDLATLSDWIAMFGEDEQRRPILSGAIVNTALERFREIAAVTRGVDLVRLQRAASDGVDESSFSFSDMDEERRVDIKNAVQTWIDFKRSMNTGLGPQQLGPQLANLLTQTVAETEIIELKKSITREPRRTLIIDVKIGIPPNPSSLILPEFGSALNGVWRVAAVSSNLSNSEIVALADGIDGRGMLVIFLGSMPLDRREQLKLECIKLSRRLLLVDELLFISALTMLDRHPSSIFELAQAFTTARPYQDYGRSSQVPPEMFKGRIKEIATIVQPYGSYIVYGGRRLGKTALLRHIARQVPEYAHFGYLDLAETSSSELFKRSASVLSQVFGETVVRTADDFERGIKRHLDGDERRRILLMLDEADNFIRDQASGQKYHHIHRLLALMADTNHRFKFVLSGLHNVSRISKSENSPLAQISNNPVRVGPLVGSDAGDAEDLVRVPLAALGYEFDKREDVWRVLSFANYYPILIQVFCQGLLNIIEDHQRRRARIIKKIPGAMIDEAMRSPAIREALYSSFEKTIKMIEQRYELLTYIVAERALIDTGEGADADGMTTNEVAERAGQYWPQAFPRGSDPSEIGYLLDEMEGFGILKRIPPSRWALRSRMLLDLMVSDEEDLLARIYSFIDRTPEPHFDPKNGRSRLTSTGRPELEAKISPLTDGQAAQMLYPDREFGHAIVLFGAPIANVELVHAAIEGARATNSISGMEIELIVRGWKDRSELMHEVRKTRTGAGTKILVVSSFTDWTPEWAIEAAKHPNVVKGNVRPLFIGSSKHAFRWSCSYPITAKTPPRIQIETLKPWARSYIVTRLDALNALKPATVDRILDATGGWNELCQSLFAAATTGAQIEKSVAELRATLGKDSILPRFGVPKELAVELQTVVEICGESTPLSDLLDVLGGVNTYEVAIRFGALMGVLAISSDPQTRGGQVVSSNPIVRNSPKSLGEE
ncbi:hypothetical protein GCM10007874_00080 [Labrys miyagiensis]|uniref:ORC1/DEAH AAA+ ATPase domain-containing protein n=1 Tax=Labrys miyagiensis TaxID=346912 RepID=A0ABQ6C9P5_9HYPH|nr:hypothetical protein GCM10007874_00080 [Labrys miyagiensis]